MQAGRRGSVWQAAAILGALGGALGLGVQAHGAWAVAGDGPGLAPLSCVPNVLMDIEPQAFVAMDAGENATSSMMRAAERVAQESGEPIRARGLLLLRLRSGMTCYPDDLPAEELANLIRQTGLMPPTQGRFNSTRYFTDTKCWLGQANIGASASSRAAQLTYSFPADGTAWGLACSGVPSSPGAISASDLDARLISVFGSKDRGREFIRSAIASWRRFGGLTYSEVADDNSQMSESTARVSTRGDIRIGGFAVLPSSAPLAYNAFPSNTGVASCGGGDMCLNTWNFPPTGSYFSNTAGNFLQFRNTIAHEHGHGLGFQHTVPCNRQKLMEPEISQGPITVTNDEVRAVIRNYGDRFSGNQSYLTPKAFGNLTSPVARSIIERDLGINGTAASDGGSPPTQLSQDDWFTFTIDSPQAVTLSAAPTGASTALGSVCTPGGGGGTGDSVACQGVQGGGGCAGSVSLINANQAGNLTLELRTPAQAANTMLAALASSSNPALGATETITYTAGSPLAAGTYYVRVFDAGGASTSNQIVQTYDLTIRVGTSLAPPLAIAGLNKRCEANQTCQFIGSHNSAATEAGASISRYDWDLDGNGSFETTNNNQPSTTYVSNGVFNVALRVTDTNNQTATDTIQVTVFGAVTTIISANPNNGLQGATVPVTINGSNFKGVTSASQVMVSGTGVSVIGTPTVNATGRQITGLSFVIAPGAATGARDITVNNSDGLGATGTGTARFTINPPSGACCLSDGTCITAADAGSCGGTFQGAGSSCGTTSCPQPNVQCCLSDGSCQFVTVAACGTLGGTAGMFGSNCTVNTCPQPTGVCCRGATCTVVTNAQCTLGSSATTAGLTFTLMSTACNQGGSVATPCCYADYNKTGGVTVQDLLDFITDWLNASTFADTGGAGATAPVVQDLLDFFTAWLSGSC